MDGWAGGWWVRVRVRLAFALALGMERWTDGRTDRRKDGWIGWMDGWTDGRKDAWMEGWIGYPSLSLFLLPAPFKTKQCAVHLPRRDY